MGWAGLKNGELLSKAEPGFNVFVTADQNLVYQQNLAGYNIAVAVLAAKTNRMEDLRPLIPNLRKVLQNLAAGAVVRISP